MKSAAKIVFLIFACVAFVKGAEPRKMWIEIDHGSLAFSLPVSFRQTDAQGIDSFVEEYMDCDAGIYLGFDFGIYSAEDRITPQDVKRETVQIGPEVATIVTRRAELSRDVAWFITLFATDRSHPKLTMTIASRSEAGLEVARAILATVKFPSRSPTKEDLDTTKDRWDRLRVINANRRALQFRHSEMERYPKRLEFPSADAVVLSLRVLRLLERKEDARLAIPHLEHPVASASAAAASFLAWAKALPADIALLSKLVDAMPDSGFVDSDAVGEVLVGMGDASVVPVLKSAIERGVSGFGSTLGRLGDESCFRFLVTSASSSPDAINGFLNLVRRSNKKVEPWMTVATYDSRRDDELRHRWHLWWSENGSSFQILRPERLR